MKNTEVNSLKVFCCNRTTQESILAKLQSIERNGYDFELIPHPVYSPDLAPNDSILFPNLKKDIHGCNFRSDEEVMKAFEKWVNGKDRGSL